MSNNSKESQVLAIDNSLSSSLKSRESQEAPYKPTVRKLRFSSKGKWDLKHRASLKNTSPQQPPQHPTS